MNRSYEMLRDAIREMNPKLSATVRKISPLPTEQTLPQIIEFLASAMEDGYPVAASTPVVVNGEVQGFQVNICEKEVPGQKMKVTVVLAVHADLDDPLGPTDCQAVMSGIMAIAAHHFHEAAKKKAASMSPAAGGAIEEFPAPAADGKP